MHGKSGPPWRVVGGVILPGLPATLLGQLLIRSVEKTLEKEITRIENVRHANKNIDSVTLKGSYDVVISSSVYKY